MIMIKGIFYIQLQWSVIKLSFKRKTFAESSMSSEKNCFTERAILFRKTFFDIIFHIF